MITLRILLRGAGIGLLWDSVLAMAAIGIALFALGLARYRTQFAWAPAPGLNQPPCRASA